MARLVDDLGRACIIMCVGHILQASLKAYKTLQSLSGERSARSDAVYGKAQRFINIKRG